MQILNAALVYFTSLIVIHLILYGFPRNYTSDGIAGHLFTQGERDLVYNAKQNENFEDNYYHLIEDFELKAIAQIGIKRRSLIIRNISDYLRLRGN